MAHAGRDLADPPRRARGANGLAACPPGRRPAAGRCRRPDRDAHFAAVPALRQRLARRRRVDDTGFDELHELATVAGDKASLAIGMAGQVFALAAYGRYREACKMVPELLNLGDSVGNPTLTVALLMAALTARFGTGELTEVMRLSQRIIDDTDADPQTGNFLVDSPLTVALMQRAAAEMCKGIPGGGPRWTRRFRCAPSWSPAFGRH